jgi:uncharacterized membrane protein (DUF485 family)
MFRVMQKKIKTNLTAKEMQKIYDMRYRTQEAGCNDEIEWSEDYVINARGFYKSLLWDLDFSNKEILVNGCVNDIYILYFSYIFLMGLTMIFLGIKLNNLFIYFGIIMCLLSVSAFITLKIIFHRFYKIIKIKIKNTFKK